MALDRGLPCPECGLVFDGHTERGIHMIEHWAVAGRCEYCGKDHHLFALLSYHFVDVARLPGGLVEHALVYRMRSMSE